MGDLSCSKKMTFKTIFTIILALVLIFIIAPYIIIDNFNNNYEAACNLTKPICYKAVGGLKGYLEVNCNSSSVDYTIYKCIDYSIKYLGEGKDPLKIS